MAIQNRRGAYADFDKSKMVAGELAVVQSGDPNVSDGKSIYVAFGPNNAKQLATMEDLDSAIEQAAAPYAIQFVDPNNDGHIVVQIGTQS